MSATAEDTRLLIQPGAGTTALLQGIDAARSTIHIVIFRFDRSEIEMALKRAARRGVFVHALVAHTSAGQGGEITLRKLEMRLLADGITVTRTASDLLRYHNKMMVIDGEELHLLGFNFTHLDIERSRSFGLVTRRKTWVDEAERLFAADATRQLYTPSCDSFVVSPGNARRKLMEMIAAGKRQLLIYDDKLSDPDVMRLLALKVRAGLDVRVIGSVGKRAIGVKASRLHMRLHAQVIIRDAEEMFLGSQSLRSLELDVRREAGIITDDSDIIAPVLATFESDWARAAMAGKTQVCTAAECIPVDEVDAVPLPVPAPLPPEVSAQLVKAAVKEAIKDAILERTEPNTVNVPLKDAVKEAAREALHELAC